MGEPHLTDMTQDSLHPRRSRWRIFLRIIPLAAFAFVVLQFNFRLLSPTLNSEARQRKDLLRQLTFLEEALHAEGMGEQMQEFYPEGYFFSHVLYGLAWCEYSNKYQTTGEERERALKEAHFALQQLEGDQGSMVFDPGLNPPYGIFYQGWCNYLRAKLVSITPAGEDTLLRSSFAEHCALIAELLDSTSSPWLESYPYQCWPSDPTLAVASLSLSRKLTGVSHDSTVTRWLTKVKDRLDPATGMIPHMAECAGDTFPEGARGCSSVLMIRFMAEMDPAFAQEQFLLLKRQFLMKRLGRFAIREYPKGTFGSGDVDSGPVVFGMGFSATIVGIGMANAMGEEGLAASLSGSIEAFGLPTRSGGKKRYIFGAVPVADAFIAWGKATAPVMPPPAEPVRQGLSVLVMHFVSLLPLLLWGWRFWRRNLKVTSSRRPAK
jgi:hypothetical protein